MSAPSAILGRTQSSGLSPFSHFLKSPNLSPLCLSPAGPAPLPQGRGTLPAPPVPWVPACDAPDVFLFVAFVAGGWLAFPLALAPLLPVTFLPAGSLAHTCPGRPPARRAPLPAAAAAAREAPSPPPPPPPRALPGAPGGGRRSPSPSALLFWVLCVINVGPPHSNQAHYKCLRARGRKSCAPPAPSLTHSLVTCLVAF